MERKYKIVEENFNPAWISANRPKCDWSNPDRNTNYKVRNALSPMHKIRHASREVIIAVGNSKANMPLNHGVLN